MATLQDVQASCAICAASAVHGECQHEAASLERAVGEAILRWRGLTDIRDWVIRHARNEINMCFNEKKAERLRAHQRYVQTLPCYTLYQRYADPPLTAPQKALWQQQMHHAQNLFQIGIDEDWRQCCMRYPVVLDYFFNLVEFNVPDDRDPAVREPRFGGKEPQRRIHPRRGSFDVGGSGRRKRSRRRGSRGRTPPPAPMPGGYRR